MSKTNKNNKTRSPKAKAKATIRTLSPAMLKKFDSIDRHLENLEYSLRELEDVVAVGQITNRTNVRRLESNWLKIDGIRFMLDNLKKAIDPSIPSDDDE
jgi:hypothetical protein